ncbi:MAG: type II toxin-antitoxin system RelE/ParE family toxin [Prevotellaceae bacterium]|nr:type II toxin-antitoxin system RelE/ParE family toxin [Prevotellaceae bacterium]
MLAAKNLEVLYSIHSLNYEVLKGEKAGISSIRVNKQYRPEYNTQCSMKY